MTFKMHEWKTKIPNSMNFTELGFFLSQEEKINNGSQGSTVFLLQSFVTAQWGHFQGEGLFLHFLAEEGMRCAPFSSLTWWCWRSWPGASSSCVSPREHPAKKKKKNHHHNRFAQVSKKHKTKHKWCVNTVIKNGALKPPVLVQWHQQKTEEDW